MYFLWIGLSFLVAIKHQLLLSVGNESRGRALMFMTLSLCMIAVTFKYGAAITEFYAELLEANHDWHCVENPSSPQCNGGMIIGHLFLLMLNGWNLVLAPGFLLMLSVKDLSKGKIKCSVA